MAERKRGGLGRGIAALIPQAEDVPEQEKEHSPRTAPAGKGARSRPVDVFFSSDSPDAPAQEAAAPGRAKVVKKKTTTRSSVPSISKGRGRKASAEEEVDASSEEQAQGISGSDKNDVTVSGSSRTATEEEASSGEDSSVQSEDVPEEQTLVPVPGTSYRELSIDSIVPNARQPRSVFDEEAMAELVHSIREIGVLQPIVVRPSEDARDEFELIMGERRWRAAKEAGIDAIPAIIRTTPDDDMLRDALLENLHRSQLNPLEEGAAYQQMISDFGISHEMLADRIGRSRSQVSNTLRLLKLPPLVQKRVAAGILSAGHARALLALEDPAHMERLAQRIVAEGLSVRTTEELVALGENGKRRRTRSIPRAGARHERLDYLERSLADRFDTSVKITFGAKKGKVTIDFGSVDDLNRIVALIEAHQE